MSANTVQNWSTGVRFSPAEQSAPSSTEQMMRVLAAARKDGRNVRPRGALHSFTPLAETSDILLSLQNFAGIDSVDAEQRTAWIKAGTNLFDLNPALHERGLAMPNLGDIDSQTLAGAFSTGTHGTGINLGVLASSAIAIEFVSGSGELVKLTLADDGDAFRAAMVNLGALGVVTRYQVALRDSFKLHAHKAPMRFGEVLERFREFNANNRHFEFYWFPHTDRTQIKLQNESQETPTEKGLWKFVDNVVVENGAFGALTAMSRLSASAAPTISKIIASAVSSSEETDWSYKVFCTVRYVKFQEMEYGVPLENAEAALRALEAYVRTEKVNVCFPVEVRFVKADSLSLAPSFGGDTCFISTHQTKGVDHTEYFRGAERIMRDHGGRPHWGKMHTLTAKELAPLYPEWDLFQAVRNKYDPERVMSSAYLKRVLGQ